jgi:hypothetical protein
MADVSPIMTRALVFFGCMLAAGPVSGAEGGVVSAAETFLAELGKPDAVTDPRKSPLMAISPFCPEDRLEHYTQGLEMLAARVRESQPRVAGETMVKGNFAGVLVEFADPTNPLDLEVAPLCLLRSDGDWRVAVGLRHFDNTHFGFDAGHRRDAGEVADETVKQARERRGSRVAEAARLLLEKRAAIRAERVAGLGREALIAAFLEFDRAGDVTGKLACHAVPEDVSPAALTGFMRELHGNLVDPPALEGESGRPGMLMAMVAAHKKHEQFCHVAGFMNSDEPTDHYLLPFYLRPAAGGGWEILPHGSEVGGFPEVEGKLAEWFQENESGLIDDLVKAVGARASGATPAAAGAAHREFLAACVRRDVPGALRLLWLPADGEAEVVATLLEDFSDLLDRLRGSSLPEPMIRSLASREEGDASAADHAVFQAFGATGQVLRLVTTEMVRRDGQWLAVVGSDPETRPDGDPTAALAAGARPTAGDMAMQFLPGDWEGTGNHADSTNVAAEPGLEQTGRDLMAALAAGDVAGLLALATRPPGKEADRGARALAEIAELARAFAGRAPQPGPSAASGAWGMVVVNPVAEAAGGPMGNLRALVFVKQSGAWRWLPGLQFFRESNRGFRALNAATTKAWRDRLGEAENSAVARLRAWFDALPPPAP